LSKAEIYPILYFLTVDWHELLGLKIGDPAWMRRRKGEE
jgi:hypothetical protein